MKKLVLAIVCLVSVAFLASCDPTIKNPEPQITVINESGYLVGNEVVDVDVAYPFGFVVYSNSETMKELARLVVVCGENTLCDTVISGTEFYYRGEIIFDIQTSKDIIGSAEIVATVTDVAGETNTASIKVDINAQLALEVAEFDWFRLGNTQSGLDEYGLYWESNLKATHAQIKPLENVKLFIFTAENWEEVTNAVQKAALFNDAIEHQISHDVYNGVSTSASAIYDDVIGTVTPDGECHLIHVTRCTIGEYQPTGYPIHITGESK